MLTAALAEIDTFPDTVQVFVPEDPAFVVQVSAAWSVPFTRSATVAPVVRLTSTSNWNVSEVAVSAWWPNRTGGPKTPRVLLRYVLRSARPSCRRIDSPQSASQLTR
jgi:hypothetical protein